MGVINSPTPVFGLYFRRYAPFDTFAGFIAGQRNEGDKRSQASTSLKVTSRTYGFVMFNEEGIVKFIWGSSGTIFHPYLYADIVGHSNVSSTIVDPPLFHGRRSFLISASTHGGYPLTPGWATPDIDTYISAYINFSGGTSLSVTGSVSGDNFPNLEVFLLCYRSMHTALLIDGRTTGSKDFGPLTRLADTNEDFILGNFNVSWPLNKKGEAIVDTTVKPIDLPEYTDTRARYILDRMSD